MQSLVHADAACKMLYNGLWYIQTNKTTKLIKTSHALSELATVISWTVMSHYSSHGVTFIAHDESLAAVLLLLADNVSLLDTFHLQQNPPATI